MVAPPCVCEVCAVLCCVVLELGEWLLSSVFCEDGMVNVCSVEERVVSV